MMTNILLPLLETKDMRQVITASWGRLLMQNLDLQFQEKSYLTELHDLELETVRKRLMATLEKFWDIFSVWGVAVTLLYFVTHKRDTNRMLLEPECTNSVTSSQCPLCLKIVLCSFLTKTMQDQALKSCRWHWVTRLGLGTVFETKMVSILVSRPFGDQNVTLHRVTRLVSRPFSRPKQCRFRSRNQYRHQNTTLW